MSSARNEAEQRRLSASWWWLEPEHAKDRSEAALAWETIRRTRVYQLLWRKFNRDMAPLMKPRGKPGLAGVFRQAHLLQNVRGAIGRPFFEFLMEMFDPGRTWMELSERQRLVAQGFVLHGNEGLQVNSQYLVSRQQTELPAVGLGLVELARESAGHDIALRQIGHGFPIGRVVHMDVFRSLTLNPLGRYVFAYFDTRGSRNALLQAFDRELGRWVGNWRAAMKHSGRFPVLWSGERHEPVEFWAPESGSDVIRAKRDELAIIPSVDPPFAVLLVSARLNPAMVRSSFHSCLRARYFTQWHPRCVEYWKTLIIKIHELVRDSNGNVSVDGNGYPLRRLVIRRLFDPKKHVPPKKKSVRSARRADLWLGLAANDVVNEGVALGKTSEEGAFLLAHCSDSDSLWNHQRSAAARLRELEREFGRLDKNLAYWNEQNSKLSGMGFFKAAAGEDRPALKPKLG